MSHIAEKVEYLYSFNKAHQVWNATANLSATLLAPSAAANIAYTTDPLGLETQFGINFGETASLTSVSLVKGLVWPALAVIAILFFHGQVKELLSTFIEKIASATNVALRIFKIEAAPGRIPVRKAGETITLANVALLHTSFLRPDKTRQFNDGLTYFQIEVVVVAPSTTLDRIVSVTYYLDETYPNPVRSVTDRQSRFKVKELANGTSIMRAEPKLKGQAEPMHLNRFIDLRPDGPRI